jgi:hypothetical protein
MSDLGSVFEIPVVNQTQFEVEEDEYKEKRNNSVSATNESGMKLLHLVKGNKNEGPVRVTGFLDEFHQEASTDNLAGASSDGNGESPEGRVSVIERRVPSSSGANSAIKSSGSLDRKSGGFSRLSII